MLENKYHNKCNVYKHAYVLKYVEFNYYISIIRIILYVWYSLKSAVLT